MRTTLTLDDHIDRKIRRLAAEQHISYREAINRTLRLGLDQQSTARNRKPFIARTHRGGFKPGVDMEKLNQAVDDLTMDDFIRSAGS